MSEERYVCFDLCHHYAPESSIGNKRRCDDCQKEVDTKFDENWRSLLYPNGELDVEEMKGDLNDYWTLMEEASSVYCHVTGGKISKTTTCASAVISEADNETQKMIDEAVKEVIEG